MDAFRGRGLVIWKCCVPVAGGSNMASVDFVRQAGNIDRGRKSKPRGSGFSPSATDHLCPAEPSACYQPSMPLPANLWDRRLGLDFGVSSGRSPCEEWANEHRHNCPRNCLGRVAAYFPCAMGHCHVCHWKCEGVRQGARIPLFLSPPFPPYPLFPLSFPFSEQAEYCLLG